MKSQDIHLNDWLRILVGEVPLGYFIELAIRALVIYLLLLISMRVMGKRMSSQMSRNEMGALVSLAAAIGVPMMAPDRGLLPAVVIAFVLIAGEWLIARQSCKSQQFESFAAGDLSVLVSDGIIDMKEMSLVALSHERLLAELRFLGILHLGEIARFYMETSGGFTLIKNPNAQPGLSVLPPWDHEMRDCFREHPENQICVQCGFPQKKQAIKNSNCPNCGKNQWVTAVTRAVNDNIEQ